MIIFEKFRLRNKLHYCNAYVIKISILILIFNLYDQYNFKDI